ncbi:GAF domain-containing protein [filamentous cyanobacterium LEGE 11480]|uniref:Oxygen sensor histidine kinase NreB n=1 Tax=Romeriopsis navalis LEGE 11480 TaxID=2777977 RepID=A0A928VR52_9CYAN|nr:GAF domain-containing protein [Romeriopsis navalis]MBE9033141.1 GAF domain-containing protein [Romeriopsis navalis LEGE 11480]
MVHTSPASSLALQDELIRRDALLASVNGAAQCLLTTNDWQQAILEVLQILGEGAQQDRVYVFQNIWDAAGELLWEIPFEWDAPGIPTQEEAGTYFPLPANAFPRELIEPMWHGGAAKFLTRDLAGVALELNEDIEALSLVAVPIYVDGDWWGVLGFDDCTTERIWSEAEVAVLQTAASCIGAAMQRDRIRQAREAAERQAIIEKERAARAAELEALNETLLTRDRWLETTALAASQLLSGQDIETSIDSVLATIGENLDCDRLIIMRYVPPHSGGADAVGCMRVLYEWDATGVISQHAHPSLSDISSEGIEDWFRQLLAGQWVGGIVDELEEPFRSGQQQLGVKATYGFPVLIEEQCWGIVSMDYCKAPKALSPAELAVFETTAACVGSAIYQEEIRRDRSARERAQLLSAVAEAASLLLQASYYETVLPEVLALLGKAVGSDRCSVIKNVTHPTTAAAGVILLHEWCQTGVLISTEYTPDLETFLAWDLVPEFYEQLMLKQTSANFLVRELQEPGRSIFVEQGNASMSAVPILINGQNWGLISFDNCAEARLYDDAEMAILKVAADCVAGAITRQTQNDALRDSEERYRNLFEVSSEGLYRFEYAQPIAVALPVEQQIEQCIEHFYIAEANHTYAAMYGFDDPKAVVGTRLADIHLKSDQNNAFVRAFIENGHQIQNYESEERDRDGQTHYFLNGAISMIRNGKVYGGWGAQLNITELKQAQQDSEEAQCAILEERNRLAREIHDTLAQSFTGISIHLEVASKIAYTTADSTTEDSAVPQASELAQAQEHLNRARDFARKGLSEARRSVLALRSGDLENDELADALQKALAIAAEGRTLETHFYLEGEPIPLVDDIQLNLLRIGQETITNAIRHAQATQLDITLCFSPAAVRLRVVDNGMGFDSTLLADGIGFGLIGIRERVTRLKGQVEMRSTPNVGTSFDVLIPLTT